MAFGAQSDELKQSFPTIVDLLGTSETIEEETHALIEAIEFNEEHCVPMYSAHDFKETELYLVLYWMLEYARTCGGDASHRYDAYAIRTC